MTQLANELKYNMLSHWEYPDRVFPNSVDDKALLVELIFLHLPLTLPMSTT